MATFWHLKHVNEVLEELKTSPHGLSSEEARKRQERYGLNELKEKAKKSPVRMLLDQFQRLHDSYSYRRSHHFWDHR